MTRARRGRAVGRGDELRSGRAEGEERSVTPRKVRLRRSLGRGLQRKPLSLKRGRQMGSHDSSSRKEDEEATVLMTSSMSCSVMADGYATVTRRLHGQQHFLKRGAGRGMARSHRGVPAGGPRE